MTASTAQPVRLGQHHILAFAGVLVAGLAVNAAETQESVELTPLEAFKRFMASPPVIEELIWQKIGAPEPNVQRQTLGVAGGQNTTGTFFQARWEPGFLFTIERRCFDFHKLVKALPSETGQREKVRIFLGTGGPADLLSFHSAFHMGTIVFRPLGAGRFRRRAYSQGVAAGLRYSGAVGAKVFRLGEVIKTYDCTSATG